MITNTIARIFRSSIPFPAFAPRQRCAAEALEPRLLLSNTLQVQISGFVDVFTARDLNNLPVNIELHDAPGMLTLTGDNLAAQTVGNHIDIAGTTSEIDDWSVSGTTAASSIVVRPNTSQIPLLSFETADPMRMIDLRPLQINGTMNIVAPPKLRLGNGSGATFNMSQSIPLVNFTGGTFSNSLLNFTGASQPTAAQAITLKFNNLMDTHLNVSPFIKTLNLHSAIESTAGAGAISANSAGTINVASDYKYDLKFTPSLGLKYTLNNDRIGGIASGAWDIPGPTNTLSAHSFDSSFGGTFGSIGMFNVGTNFSGSLTAGSIGNAGIHGNMLDGTFMLTNPFAANSWNLGSLHVGNTIEGSTIMSNGNLGTIGTMYTYYSQIEAGINPAYNFGQPLGPSDYTSYSIIKSFTSDCPSHHNMHFLGSYVGAYDLQNIRVGNVQTQNSGVPFGFAGFRMDKLSVLLAGKMINLNMLNSNAGFETGLVKYGLTESSLADFKVLFPM